MYRAIVGGTDVEVTDLVEADPSAYTAEQHRALAWAIIEADMLQHLVNRRLSDRLDSIEHGPAGSIDKLLNTYLYSRAQSVMGGTSQIQKNLIASRILGLAT